MTVPPTGTVTFLFSDIEGSTRLWEQHGDRMPEALQHHDELLARAVESSGGKVVKSTGDGTMAVFAAAADAAIAAVAAQRMLRDAPPDPPLRVRIGTHTGVASERDGDYFGPTLNRAARLMAIGHGGQILVSHATEQLLRDALAPDLELVDLGEHRLRDLSRPERVFQLTASDLVRDFPPLRSLDHAPTNLPVQLTAFIGRDEELVDLAKIVAEARVVTLTGVGGVGKTRLALQAAADRLAEQRDGVWLVELGAVSDAAAVDDVVARALGVHVAPGMAVADALRKHLESRELLIVLDNCEHLLDVVAALVDDVVRHCPAVRVLATSREPIGVVGEHIMRVASLGVPPEHAPVADLRDAEATRLLVDRAVAVRHDFAVTPQNAAAIAQICRRLDGIPLAIELAAARLRSATPAEIAARLDQRFRLLTGGSRTAADRHQTLRRTIDWSYDLLDDTERVVLQRAAVFAGGFQLDAAEVVCATASNGPIDSFDVLDLLDRLVDKSLLVADEIESATRYRMLETIRDYALERLAHDGDVTEVRRTHAVHFARFASAAGAGLRGTDEAYAIELVERELENLRTAMTWALEHDEITIACDIVEALAIEMIDVNNVVGQWAETIATAPGADDDPRWPQILAFASFSALRRGDVARAKAWRATALERAVDAHQRLRVLDAAFVLASFADDVDAWVDIGEERIALARAIDDEYELVRALASCVAAHHARHEDATAMSEEAVARARRLGNPSCICSATMTAAGGFIQSDPDRALALLAEAERAAITARNRSLARVVAGVRGFTLYSSGATAAALRSSVQTMQDELDGGFVSLVLGNILMIADALVEAGHDDDAAILVGFWRAAGVGYEAKYELAPPRADMNVLPERLGARRYDELLAQGASLGFQGVVDAARAAVDRLLADEASAD